VQGDPRDRFVEEFAGMVRPGGRVLDLGCGAGVPSTRRLAESFSVVGVDISAEQLTRARRNVPVAELVQADLREVCFPAGSFDGVCALYSIAHVPREDHAQLFSSIGRWLRPGGVFLASLGSADLPAWTGDWLGVPMFFSSHSAAENRRLLDAAGLEPVRDEVVTIHEPEGDATFQWVLRLNRGQTPNGGRAPFVALP
jgi:SAM-dependent methyltransferase